MNRTRQQIIDNFLQHPDLMLQKKPFTRGISNAAMYDKSEGASVSLTERRTAVLPKMRKQLISQERFARELDPECHDVIFDDNIPSVCVKVDDGGYKELKFLKFGLPFQERIREKKTLTLCGNNRIFTLHDSDPDPTVQKNFADFKWHWKHSNQDGLDNKAIYTQLGYGDAGLLVYINENNEAKGRIFSYEDGYQIISHNDDNGERVMECIYYADENEVRHIVAYDDKFVYEFVDGDYEGNKVPSDSGWCMVHKAEHGFSEIPLATKRGDVAWNLSQSLISLFEIIYNIFAVIQKRHGWGILYIKGRINESVKKIAGSIVLNDTSIDGKGDVEFKTPPSPEGTIEFLQSILDQIAIASGVTFILPKDVKSSGDISGLAIQMTRSLDMETAAASVLEWQNFADKHCRLFKEALAKQLVLTGENPNAITEFQDMKISCKFKPWQPFDENQYNQMLATLKGAGILSAKTAVEKNTMAAPDEEARLKRESESPVVSPSSVSEEIVKTEGEESTVTESTKVEK